MAKVVRGSAGRLQRREEMLEHYGNSLATLMIKQVRPSPGDRIMHLGSPGAIAVAEALAPALDPGELVVVVYTYDETEEARAALAGLGNVEVISDLEDLDPDEPPYDIITCIVPYHLRKDDVDSLISAALRLMSPDGIMYLAGDKQQGFERNVALVRAEGSEVTPLVQSGQLRMVTATRPGPGGGLRRRAVGS